jgi:hypothetical protein
VTIVTKEEMVAVAGGLAVQDVCDNRRAEVVGADTGDGESLLEDEQTSCHDAHFRREEKGFPVSLGRSSPQEGADLIVSFWR